MKHIILEYFNYFKWDFNTNQNSQFKQKVMGNTIKILTISYHIISYYAIKQIILIFCNKTCVEIKWWVRNDRKMMITEYDFIEF